MVEISISKHPLAQFLSFICISQPSAIPHSTSSCAANVLVCSDLQHKIPLAQVCVTRWWNCVLGQFRTAMRLDAWQNDSQLWKIELLSSWGEGVELSFKTKNENKICFLGYKSKLLSLVVTLRGGDFGKKGTSRSCEHKTAGNHPPDVARERNTWPTIKKSILHVYQTQVQSLSWCSFPWDQQQLHHISISKKWLQKIALTLHHFTEKNVMLFMYISYNPTFCGVELHPEFFWSQKRGGTPWQI